MRQLKFKVPGPSIDWTRIKLRLRSLTVLLGGLLRRPKGSTSTKPKPSATATPFTRTFDRVADWAVVKASRGSSDWSTVKKRLSDTKITLDWAALKEAIRPPTVVLSFDEDAVRMVVLRGGRVVDWGMGKLPDESISEEQEAGSRDAAFATSLRSLLEEHSIRRCRVVTELPLYASLLRHLTMPNIPRRFLGEVIISEVVETIPFSKEEVEITWQVHGGDADQKVFAVALRKEAIDNHVRLLEQADVRPSQTYPKAVALALAAGKPDAIVAHITSSQADIVLVRERMPQVVNQLVFPEGGEDSEKQAEAVVSAVEQMAGYYQDYQAFAAVDRSASLPVILAGEVLKEDPLADGIRKALKQREVLHCAPPIEYPEHFPASEYAVNLGLALASQATAKREIFGVKAVHTNLLPERYLPRPLPVIPVVIFTVLLVLGAVAFTVAGRVEAKESEAERLTTGVERVERLYRLSRARAVKSYQDAEGLRNLVETVDSRLVGIQLQLQSLVTLAETVIDTALPPSVSIPGLAPLGDEISISGSAATYGDVLLYVENLRASGLFSSVLVQEVRGPGITGQQDGEESISFQLKLVVASTSDSEGEAEE